MKLTTLKAAGIALSVAACQPFLPATPPPAVAPPQPDFVDQALAEAVLGASRAMQDLARVQTTLHPPARPLEPVTNAPPKLQARIAIDYAGEIEPLLQRVASRAGYQLTTAGSRTGTPVLVDVRGDLSLFEILRDAGLQAGARAHVRVNPGTRTVQIDYQGGRQMQPAGPARLTQAPAPRMKGRK
jgi:hypothetical protein